MRRLIPLFALSLGIACDSKRDARYASGSAACPLNEGSILLESERFAGIPTRMPLGQLQLACPDARVDTVGVGGTQPIALSFVSPGAVISAVQTRYEAYGDSIHANEPADLWIARGDSLRFPDGTLMPTSVRALRALDSSAVIIIDHGDDGTGSYVVRCRYPYLAFIVSNVWPTFADTGAVSLARVDRNDTTSFWRVKLMPSADTRIQSFCARPPAL